MPQFNGTGPFGEGSQTGRKLGKCTGENPEATETSIKPGRGFRFRFQSDEFDELRGQGRGRGWRAGVGRGKGRGRGMGNRFGNRF